MAIPIDFDKPRTLKFDLPAIQDLEQRMGGVPIGAIIQQLTQAGVTAVVLSLWAGLKHEDAALTPNLVTKMLTRYIAEGKSMRDLAVALNAAIMASGIFNGVAVEDSAEPADAGKGRRGKK